MNLFSISSLLTAITTFAISLLLMSKGLKRKDNRIFLGVPICGALWGLGSYMATISSTREAIFMWWQIAYVGGIVFSTIYISILYAYLLKQKERASFDWLICWGFSSLY